MPGVVFIGYFFLFIIVFDLISQYRYFIGITDPELFSYAIPALVLIGLFSVGLLIRTYPYDHWPIIRGHIRKEYGKIDDYIKLKFEKEIKELKKETQDNPIFENEKDWLKAMYRYLESDKLDSNAVFFYKAGYMFWFNFLTICLVFFVLGIFATFVGILYSYFTTLHLLGIRTYFILSWLLVIKTKERGEDTLKWYVSSAILAVDNFVKNKLNKRPSTG